MKKFKFLVSRKAIYFESYYVEADSEEELWDIVHGDGPDYNDPVEREWVDWYGEWEIDGHEERDRLLVMVSNFKKEEA